MKKECKIFDSNKKYNSIENNNINYYEYHNKNLDKFINIDKNIFKSLNREEYNKIKNNLIFLNNQVFLNIYDCEMIINEKFNNYIKKELIQKIINNKDIIRDFIYKNYMDNYHNYKEIKLARKKYLNYIKKIKRNIIKTKTTKNYSEIDIINLINK